MKNPKLKIKKKTMGVLIKFTKDESNKISFNYILTYRLKIKYIIKEIDK